MKIIILVTTLALACMIILKEELLEIPGDVELNPDPYKVIESVQGSFNQGKVSLFGETTGRQCACNAMFSICWSFIRKISCWTHQDL